MGCLLSSARFDGGSQDDAQLPFSIVTFFPGLRLPSQTNTFDGEQIELESSHVTEKLLACQDRLVALAVEGEMAAGLSPNVRSDRRKSASQHPEHGEGSFADLQQALEDYLVLLLSSAKEDTKFELPTLLIWKNQEDEQLETPSSNWLQEVLSILHAMAVLDLFQANLLLSQNSYQMGSKGRSKQAIDILLKVSGVLDCAVKYIIPKFSEESRVKLPSDLKGGVLHALSMQALGQGVEIQLGLAMDDMKATLAVKRRLACEQVEYLQKAHEDLQEIEVDGLWGQKHQLFISWKLAEAKAAAFYFHGLVLDESEDFSRADVLLCLKSASGYLKESQKLCQSFCLASPMTRSSSVWGAMKFLSETIPKEFSSKTRSYRVAAREEMHGREVPKLPDFPLSLYPEEFKLPVV